MSRTMKWFVAGSVIKLLHLGGVDLWPKDFSVYTQQDLKAAIEAINSTSSLSGNMTITIKKDITLSNPLPLLYPVTNVTGVFVNGNNVNGNNFMVSGDGKFPLFRVFGSSTQPTTFSNLRLVNGMAHGGNGGDFGGGGGAGMGGALFVYGNSNVTLEKVTLTDNGAKGGDGGAGGFGNFYAVFATGGGGG